MTYQLDVIDIDDTAGTTTTLLTDQRSTIADITDPAPELLIERAGPELVTIVITGPDGRRYPFGQAVGTTDTDEIRRRADDLIYGARACIHWHDDEARTLR